MANRKRTFVLLLFLAVAGAGHSHARNAPDEGQDACLIEAVEGACDDVEAAKQRLIETRRAIADERLKKTVELTRLEEEVARLREQWRTHARAADAGGERRRELLQEAERIERLLDGTWNTLVEARRNAETRVSLSDRKRFEGDLQRIDAMLDHEGDGSRLAECGRAVLALLLSHVRACSRVRETSGTAIDDAGNERSGTFIHLGGIGALFVDGEESGACGFVRIRHGSAHPHVWPLSGEEERKAVRCLAEGKSATVPLDLSGGAALRSLQAGRTLSEEVRAGGAVMIPILALALVCLLVGLWKFFRLWRIPVSFDARVASFTRSLYSESGEAGAIVDKARGPSRRLLAEAFAHAGASRDRLEEVLHEVILSEVPRLESKLSVLSVGAAVAPLLGLLGTVTGMIHTFRLISLFGSGDARMLSSGISEALVTTEAGLIVAIPLLLLHAVLNRRVRSIEAGLDRGALTILNGHQAGVPANGKTP